VYVAPLGLWLTLDAGTFERVEILDDAVRVSLAPATTHTPVARLRIERPAVVAGVRDIRLRGSYAVERGAHVIPLGPEQAVVELRGGDD
jgi:hypothetical protein